MDRTKVFLSYSHADRNWLDRLETHLAVLERQKLVQVWTDVRIEAGDEWKKRIHAALSEARVAVLLITPTYLASKFIWDNEIPPIMEHKKDGMLVLPLVARPCAWRLEERLAELQARPEDGRPMSAGTEAQIDLDLATFAYELAGIVGKMNAAAEQEWQRMMGRPEPEREDLRLATSQKTTPTTSLGSPRLERVWRGHYDQTDMGLVLSIKEQSGAEFTGTIEYDHGAVTEVAGRVTSRGEVTFSELRITRQGKRAISLDGEYRALLDQTRRQLAGGWFFENEQKGDFVLVAETDGVTGW